MSWISVECIFAYVMRKSLKRLTGDLKREETEADSQIEQEGAKLNPCLASNIGWCTAEEVIQDGRVVVRGTVDCCIIRHCQLTCKDLGLSWR